MVLKTNKGKKSSSSSPDKEDTSTKPWPDVPKQLLSIVARKSTLMNNFSYGGVTKSWRVSPKQCHPTGKSPFPQLADITDSGRTIHVGSKPTTFVDILFRVGEYWWTRREHPRQFYRQHYSFHFKGYSQGVLVGTKYDPSQYQLWDPVKRIMQNLPSWDKDVPFKHVALSSSPFGTNSSFIIMVITGLNKPAFMFAGSKGGDYKWVKQDCTISDPYSSNNQLMQFTNVISFQQKFYALSLQGTLAVLEMNSDHELRITGLGKNRSVPSFHSKHFREYLLESNGEILLVFLIYRKSINVVDYVEVFRLQFERLSWEKLEGLGDRTLFMGANCCVSITSSNVGCRSNCVYFSREEAGWWIFDMETHTISPGWDNINSATMSETWNEPTPGN